MAEPSDKQLVRIASLVLDQLHAMQRARQADVVQGLTNLACSLEQVRQVAGQLALASGRNWRVAADHLLDRATSCVRDLPYCMQEVENTVESSRISVPTLRDILGELRQVQEECGDLQYSPQGPHPEPAGLGIDMSVKRVVVICICSRTSPDPFVGVNLEKATDDLLALYLPVSPGALGGPGSAAWMLMGPTTERKRPMSAGSTTPPRPWAARAT